jgi:hypothetical protein
VAVLILPTDLILPAGLILATLNIVWVHCVIEVANDVVEAPNPVNITGTVSIKEITVTAVITVSVGSLTSLDRIKPLIADFRSLSGVQFPRSWAAEG